MVYKHNEESWDIKLRKSIDRCFDKLEHVALRLCF